MKNRWIVWFLCLGFSIGQAAPDRPNMVFLLADDHRWDRFGFMGHDWLETPHLDRLASEGVVFTRAYHAVPICQPSRASIMLGQYVNTHLCGFDRPSIWAISRAEFAKSYPVLLRASGYFTGFVGKFGFPVAEKKVLNVSFVDGRRDAKGQLWKLPGYQPIKEFDVWSGFAGQGTYKGPQGRHGTEHRGNQALDFIDQAAKQDKPFCLSLSFKAPHGPFTPSKKWAEHYARVDIPLPENADRAAWERLPEVVKNKYRGRNGHGKKFLAAMRGYYGLVSGVDEVVGRIRSKLASLKLDRNTVVVYTSDNGYFCQSKGLSGKDLLYRESVRAPLLIFDPRLPKTLQGRQAEGLVSTVDYGPTLLDLGGTAIPAGMQGKSLVPLLKGEKEMIHEAVFSENNFTNFELLPEDLTRAEDRKAYTSVRSKCVRTAAYKYIRYHECDPPVEELWAIEKDGLETTNLAGNPEYGSVLAEMRKRLDAFNRRTEAARKALSPPANPIRFKRGAAKRNK